jgi:hypothetical protein
MNEVVYRVRDKVNSYNLPFPDEYWMTREEAQKFADDDAPDGWAGKLEVYESEL